MARLRVHRIRGDKRALKILVGEQGAERADLVGFAVHLRLGDHSTLAVDHRGEQVHATALLIDCAPHGLAVQCEHQALLIDTALADLLVQPCAHDLVQTISVNPGKRPTKRVGVRRDEPLMSLVIRRAECLKDRLGTVGGELTDRSDAACTGKGGSNRHAKQ